MCSVYDNSYVVPESVVDSIYQRDILDDNSTLSKYGSEPQSRFVPNEGVGFSTSVENSSRSRFTHPLSCGSDHTYKVCFVG
jgi:hypothetical protein